MTFDMCKPSRRHLELIHALLCEHLTAMKEDNVKGISRKIKLNLGFDIDEENCIKLIHLWPETFEFIGYGPRGAFYALTPQAWRCF